MDPYNIKFSATHLRENPQGRSYFEAVPPANSRKKLVFVAVQQRSVPVNLYAAEILVRVRADGNITEEENREINVGLLRDTPQQGSLILDRMTDKICELHG